MLWLLLLAALAGAAALAGEKKPAAPLPGAAPPGVPPPGVFDPCLDAGMPPEFRQKVLDALQNAKAGNLGVTANAVLLGLAVSAENAGFTKAAKCLRDAAEEGAAASATPTGVQTIAQPLPSYDVPAMGKLPAGVGVMPIGVSTIALGKSPATTAAKTASLRCFDGVPAPYGPILRDSLANVGPSSADLQAFADELNKRVFELNQPDLWPAVGLYPITAKLSNPMPVAGGPYACLLAAIAERQKLEQAQTLRF